jgi:hypothetical protein
MGDAPPAMTLDRINGDGDYEPGNCRWASHVEQMNTTRFNRRMVVAGESFTVAEAARRLGIPAGRIYARLSRGWSDERAFSV